MALEFEKKYSADVLKNSYEICCQMREEKLFGKIMPPLPQKIFGLALKQLFPNLNEKQINELYSYSMHASR